MQATAPESVQLPEDSGSSANPETIAKPGPALPRARPPSLIFLGVVSILVLASDLASKGWAVRMLERNGHRLPPIELVKGRIAFSLARNAGGAWGMLQDQPERLRRPFFVLVSVLAVVVIVGMYRKLDSNQRALRWGLPLVLGGALGNLVDRVRFGQVVDFIDIVYWRTATHDVHWPTFNVADIAICVGVGLMAIDFLFPHRRVRRPSPATRAA